MKTARDRSAGAHRSSSKFDSHASDYKRMLDKSIGFSGFSLDYYAERKISEMFAYLGLNTAAGPVDVFNFGCGVGESERYIRKYFPQSRIFSSDVSGPSISVAQARNQDLQDVFFQVQNDNQIPFDLKFDIILAANVFHHIPGVDRRTVLVSLYDRLMPHGKLFIFEHNPFNPITRMVVRGCSFDEDAELVTPPELRRLLETSGFIVEAVRYYLFFPKFLSFMIPFERLFHRVPVGAQYYAIGNKTAEKQVLAAGGPGDRQVQDT